MEHSWSPCAFSTGLHPLAAAGNHCGSGGIKSLTPVTLCLILGWWTRYYFILEVGGFTLLCFHETGHTTKGRDLGVSNFFLIYK